MLIKDIKEKKFFSKQEFLNLNDKLKTNETVIYHILKNNKELWDVIDDVKYSVLKKLTINIMFSYEIVKLYPNDERLIRELVKVDPYILKNTKFKSDKNFILNILNESPRIISFIDDNLYKDKKFMLNIINVSNNIKSLIHIINKNFEGDTILEKEIVNKFPNYYQYLSEFAQCDKKIFINAFSRNLQMIKHAPSIIKNDKELMIKAIKINSFVYPLLNKSIKEDPDVIDVLIKKDGNKFDLIPESFKNIKNFKKALRGNGGISIKFFRDKKEYALLMIEKNVSAYNFLTNNLKEDKDIVLKTINNVIKQKINGFLVPTALYNDYDIMLLAVDYSLHNLSKISNDLNKNKEFVESVKNIINNKNNSNGNNNNRYYKEEIDKWYENSAKLLREKDLSTLVKDNNRKRVRVKI